MGNNQHMLSMEEGLFRFQVVSKVQTQELLGEPRSGTVKAVAAAMHITANGEWRKVSERTIYRWLSDYEAEGFQGLMPKERERKECCAVLPVSLLDFFKDQKAKDIDVGIPELILRAKALHMEGSEQADRVTVWRSLNRMGIDTSSRKSIRHRDARRFAYPHRMNMVLCDGKHFRAGIKRLRRVALFFIDDATRKVLDVVVGTSENAQLFLQGWYRVLLRYGLMGIIYIDQGPGFIANDVIKVAAQLKILLIHGEAAYPEGHGKVERFNQTAKGQVIRYLDNNPEVDPACPALELRLRHYANEQYNHTIHESLDKQTPENRFQDDPQPLRFHESHEELKKAFIIHYKRRVSFDNVVSFNSVDYEIPFGYAGSHIVLYQHLLNETLSIVHQGRLLKLVPVDLAANARSKRAKLQDKSYPEELVGPLPKGSAQISFEKEYHPVVDTDGNFFKPDKENE